MKKMNINFRTLVKVFILFGLEFDVRLVSFITLRKLAFLLLLILISKKLLEMKPKSRFEKSTAMVTILFLLLFVYARYILRDRIDENGMLSGTVIFNSFRIIQDFLYMIFFPSLLFLLFDNCREFCIAQWMITLFQAGIIILERLSLKFSLFIYNYFYSDDGRLLDGIMKRRRVVGISIGGAQGSVVLFAGCMCCVYLLLHERSNKTVQKLLIEYFFVLFSMFFMGRTGLYFAGLVLGIITFYSFVQKPKIFLFLITIETTAIFLIGVYLGFAPSSPMKTHYTNWIGEIFTNPWGEGSTINILLSFKIPKLTRETFWGMGILYGTSKIGTVVQNDSGYIMMYAALGIPGSILMYGIIYLFYFNFLIKCRDKKSKFVFGLFLFCIIIFELKEPFIGKTPLLTILSTMMFLENGNRFEHQLEYKNARKKERYIF